MSSTPISDMGLFGLAVMGQNFALNVAEKGFNISVCNRSPAKVDACVERAGKELKSGAGKLTGFKDKKSFVASLKKPRRVMFLVKAGPSVDAVVQDFLELLEEGDIMIDGGNEWYLNSERRGELCKEKGIHYIAMGVSGGETGARNGPSLMVGGFKVAYEHLKPIVEAASAKTDSGNCVSLFEGQGAGNYVKMVHNGIEYGDMQLIAEIYDILKHAGLSNDELGTIFEQWNKGELDSYLIEITSIIFKKKDTEVWAWANSEMLPANETGYVLDKVLDKTGNKGTGKMTCKESCDTGVAAGTIAEALFARFVAADYDDRQKVSAVLETEVKIPSDLDKEQLIEDCRKALYASKICSYAQGLNIIKTAAKEKGWRVNLGECARIWKGGCIIRAKLLDRIMKAYGRDSSLPNLMMDEEFSDVLRKYNTSWRRVITLGVATGIPTAALSASLAYFDSYRRKRLPANLVQAQRDFFGSHTFERIDQPRDKFYHCKWTDQHASL